MSLKRLLPGRWLRIIGWALAGVSWGTTAVAVAAGAGESDVPPAPTSPTDSTPVVSEATPVAQQAPLPDPPASGLVILRFTPVERPAAQVITRTVTVSGTASSGPAQPTSSPTPVTVTSGGS
jgi:hypothetical protein